MPLPRYARRPLRAQGAGTIRKRQVRQFVYQTVARRCRGRCELCGAEWERMSGRPLDPHHPYGRRGEYADTPETIIGACRPCHDAIHDGDVKLTKKARMLVLERFCLRRDLELPELLAEFGPDPIDVWNGAARRLEERT